MRYTTDLEGIVPLVRRIIRRLRFLHPTVSQRASRLGWSSSVRRTARSRNVRDVHSRRREHGMGGVHRSRNLLGLRRRSLGSGSCDRTSSDRSRSCVIQERTAGHTSYRWNR